MFVLSSNVILGLGDPDYVAPGDNPIVAALAAGSALVELMKEIASFFILLVVAGNETTRNAISHGIKRMPCAFTPGGAS